MPDDDEAQFSRLLRLFVARGGNRIRHLNAIRVPEIFAKESAPQAGGFCVLVQDLIDDYELQESETDLAIEDDHDVISDMRIIALAVVRAIAGAGAGAVRATIAPIHRLARPIRLSELQGGLIDIDDMPPEFPSRQLYPPSAADLIAALKERDPGLTSWLTRMLRPPRAFTAVVNQSRAEARDAVQLAAQLAEVELPADAFIVPEAMEENETLLETRINGEYEQDLEEELLPLDLQRFDGKLIGKQERASLAVFEDRAGRKKLVVMSVNKKPIELELGVDLLSWDQVHDAFTFIQYKRLEKVSRSTGEYEWAYTRDSEIAKQLKLMPIGKAASPTAADWRAFGTPFWFKFVRGDAGAHLDEKTLKGMNVPADWLRLAMTDGSLASGPRGGFRVTYENTKYIGRSAFTQLVSRGFVGTTKARSKPFKKLLRAKKRELIVAIRTEWQSDDSEPTPPTEPAGFPDLPF
ncbi:hypothetical protein JVX92_08985 [Microbacterium hominis]|uniref:hypothetical protein n=1 Tax=Microbacterium hominis TaxID=162426 RepID=UPI001963B0EF|nr:hypothetical protein [Microbacterium hominis]QRY39677.1 hypothetical protein JVX92_08985 [Microbacterium hominis]